VPVHLGHSGEVTAEEQAAFVISRRGYLVLGCEWPLSIGAIVQPDLVDERHHQLLRSQLSQPMHIFAETDVADYHEQNAILDVHPQHETRYHYFYRAQTD
jgi:hypothetical protein